MCLQNPACHCTEIPLSGLLTGRQRVNYFVWVTLSIIVCNQQPIEPETDPHLLFPFRTTKLSKIINFIILTCFWAPLDYGFWHGFRCTEEFKRSLNSNGTHGINSNWRILSEMYFILNAHETAQLKVYHSQKLLLCSAAVFSHKVPFF